MLLPALICLSSVPLSAQQARVQTSVDQPGPGVSPAGFYTVVDGTGSLRAGIWLDDRINTSDEDIFMVVSNDYGLTWSDETNLTNGSGNLVDVDFPQVIVTGNRIHVLFDDDRAGAGTDTTEYRVYDTSGSLLNSVIIPTVTYGHEIHADGDYVVIGYTNRPGGSFDELFTITSTDGGLTWPNLATPDAVDSANTGLYDVDGFQVEVQDFGGGSWSAHIIFEDDRNGNDDLWYARSDNGSAWGTNARLDQDATGNGTIFTSTTANTIHVVGNGDYLHVLWQEDNRVGGDEAVYYRRWDGVNNVWDAEQRIGAYTEGTDDTDYGNLDAEGSVVAIAWADDRNGDNPTRIVVSTDSGLTFGSEHEVAGGGVVAADSEYIRVMVECNTIVVGWEDDSYTSGSLDERPVFVISQDAGATWTSGVECGLFDSDEDVDMADEAWSFGSGSISALWQTDGGSANPDGVEAGGMRLPYISATVDTGNRTIQLAMAGVDSKLAGDIARWAASSTNSGQVHPENPGLFIDLGPGQVFTKTLNAAAFLSATVQANGSATTAVLPVPAQASGLQVYLQGWVNSAGTGGTPSDTLFETLP